MRILCFGDSNTYGYDPRSFFGDRYNADNRWVDLIASQTGWEMINLGVNGREIPRSLYVLRQLEEYAPVDVVLVMLGTNDLLQGASAEKAACLMEDFLARLVMHCKCILLVAPPPMKRGAWVPTDHLAAESVRLAQAYQQIADRLHIAFADTRDWHVELAFDGVHFSETGHHIFAARMKEYCQTLFPALDSHLTS